MFDVIRRNPALPLATLIGAMASPTREPSQSPGARDSYTGYARFALLNILKLLNFERGSRVLLPAYICDVVLLPLEALGLEPVYYGITDAFEIDFDCVKIPPKTKAIITVNYFGMSLGLPAVESFVRSHDLVWINDNSHGFASRHGTRRLETVGDFSVTSFRKVVPAVNGARARINNDNYASMTTRLAALNRPAAVERQLLRFVGASILGNLGHRPQTLPDYSDPMAFAAEGMMDVRMDAMSGYILQRTIEDAVQQRRARLYQAVDAFFAQQRIEHVEPRRGMLQPGNSPMVYPVMVDDPERWKAILRAGRDQGIDIHTWPSMPRKVIEGDLFGALAQWRKFLFLPIHQDLEPTRYCARLSDVFAAAR